MSMNDSTQSSLTDGNTSTIFVEKLFQKIILGCFLSSLSIFTVCGNILVLYAIQTEKNLRTVSNLFILSLALADLAVGLFVMPLSAAQIIAGRWPFSSVICKMWLSIDYVASTASIFNLVLLSLDRYWAVVYPLRYLRKRTRRRATVFILIVWFIASLWAPAIIFWSYIAPQHSDTIKQNECDTSFRSNKTFKTLTALVNFYFPLLTMIIVSCRIMVAIRSRSQMEYGRRLSSTTQKQMKLDRTFKTSIRDENQTNFKFNNTSRPLLPPRIVTNPLDSSIPDYQPISNNINDNITPTIEPGQCFCSTCQPSNENDNESLWEVQQSPIKKSNLSQTKHFSFAQIKPLSRIFSPKKLTEENTIRKSLEAYKTTYDNDNIKIRNSFSESNNMKYSMIIYSNEHSQKHLSPVLEKASIKQSTSSLNKIPIKQSKSRTVSITSSFSDECVEPIFFHSTEDQQKSKSIENMTIQQPTISNQSQPINSSPKLAKTVTAAAGAAGNDSIMTNRHDSSAYSSTHNTPKMSFSFFHTLINPSHSKSLQKELKAARQLGMLVGVFTVSWLPYFILFLVVAWCNHCVSDTIFVASIWLGYLNSTFNPLIYPLCNAHFRRAFQKICYCKHEKTKLPNLNALRELQVLHGMRQRR
ncbi:unnamed protein product [Rotaria sordida]|uniref:G-protein coupled receptors family 1 profile domain-containing protein n=1 Tax=Rotaria sordida TaxID=392033 RepID=A0A813MV65_9BILA|nr:unnamed protein product [Rotaria sordida]CAF1213404.1 unnamed protein product [Rotaria sordida]